MEYSELSDQDLQQHLADVLLAAERDTFQVDGQVGAAVRLHRLELEMQNRHLCTTRAELEHAIHRYADLYDHLPIACLKLTSSGRIVEANATAANWFGFEHSRVIGTYLRQYVRSCDRERYAAQLDLCVRSGKPASINVILEPDAEIRTPIQLSFRPVTVRNGSPEVHAALTDISALKRAEAELQQVNAEQEAFNYAVSHDLRSPLLTISNFARILSEEHAPQLNEEGRRIVERIEKAAIRMDEMLRGVLTLSRLSRATLTTENVPLELAINDALVQNRAAVEATTAEVIVERPLATVSACATLVSQVMAQLLTNALKYARPEVPPRVRISAETMPSTVIVKIADEGIGIAPQYLERIFHVFEQLHPRGRYAGNGIGLAIVRRAVQRMNGRVWAESNPGHGSCFFVELPRGM